jgi:hypothetical protein
VRCFRRDGHDWQKKGVSQTVRETHEKLKVGERVLLNCYYCQGAEAERFQRRCYWLLEDAVPAEEGGGAAGEPLLQEEPPAGVVLVHYLDTSAMTWQQPGAGEARSGVDGGGGGGEGAGAGVAVAPRPPRRRAALGAAAATAAAAAAFARADSPPPEEEEDDDARYTASAAAAPPPRAHAAQHHRRAGAHKPPKRESAAAAAAAQPAAPALLPACGAEFDADSLDALLLGIGDAVPIGDASIIRGGGVCDALWPLQPQPQARPDALWPMQAPTTGGKRAAPEAWAQPHPHAHPHAHAHARAPPPPLALPSLALPLPPARLKVLDYAPRWDSGAGGARVLIVVAGGNALSAAQTPLCALFDRTPAPARWVAPGVLACVAPPRSCGRDGPVALSVAALAPSGLSGGGDASAPAPLPLCTPVLFLYCEPGRVFGAAAQAAAAAAAPVHAEAPKPFAWPLPLALGGQLPHLAMGLSPAAQATALAPPRGALFHAAPAA